MSLDKKAISSSSKKPERRKFLFEILKKSGQIVMATGFVYSISLIADKNGISAGAK